MFVGAEEDDDVFVPVVLPLAVPLIVLLADEWAEPSSMLKLVDGLKEINEDRAGALATAKVASREAMLPLGIDACRGRIGDIRDAWARRDKVSAVIRH